jgi:nucleotide-binding universal stress UspA family protein
MNASEPTTDQTTDQTTTAMPAPGSVVVGVDGSASSLEAVAWAAEQARLDHRTLTLVHAYTLDRVLWVDSMGVDRDILKVMEADGRKLLLAAADRAHETCPDLEVHEWLFQADARSALLDAAAEAAMLVVGSRGRGPVASLLLGSVGVALVRHATCPVVVRRPEVDHVGSGVLVGVDLHEDALQVLEVAYHLAASRRVPLSVLALHHGSPYLSASDVDTLDRPDRSRLTAWLADLAVKYPDVKVTERDADGSAARVLVEQGGEKDLLVVATHVSGGKSAVLGQGLAVTVVEHAPTTVVVVPLV